MSAEQVETQSIQVAGATDVGNERDSNEDRFLAVRLEPGPNNPWRLSAVLMVADGVGGQDEGEVASGMAYDVVNEYFVQGKAWRSQQNCTDAELQEAILDVIDFINRRVHAYGAEKRGHPATTLTLCLCRDSYYHIGHVGDSRAYLLSDRKATQVTEDDSWVADAVRSGKMTQEQAENSPFRNQITKSIGTSASVKASFYSGSLSRGDALLLCSDGLSEYVRAEEMQSAVAQELLLQSACGALIDLAKRRGGHDNITVAALNRGDRPVGARKPPTRGVAPAKPPTRRFAMSPLLLRETNRVLRVVLVLLVCAASTVMGLYFGHQWVNRRNTPVVHGKAAASETPAANQAGDNDTSRSVNDAGKDSQ